MIATGKKLFGFKIVPAFWRSSAGIALIVILIYSVLGLIAYWPILPWSSTMLPTCACADPVQSVWFLRWVPFAISHGHNPLYTTWLNYPVGANLAQNTLMPLLGLLTAPISLLISPVTSFNFLAWLAFPSSAFAMFYLLRYFTKSALPAFVAGLLYGFSTYMVGQASTHMMLSFIPLPPLIVLACWKLLVEQTNKSWFLGILLGAEVVVQFLIEPEVLALTALAVIIGTLILAVLYKKMLTAARLRYALKGLVVTVLIAVVFLAYPIWFMVAGPNHFTGSNFPKDNPYRSDLIGLVAPTLNEKFVPPPFHNFASTTAGGDFQETGDYIGLPLLLILIIGMIRFRRNRWLVVSMSLAAIFWILSLGPKLVVNGTLTGVRLPFEAILHLPLLENILPSRFSMLEWLFLAITAGLLVRDWQTSYKPAGKIKSRWLPRLVFGLLLLGTLIALIPRWPYGSQSINTVKALSGSNTIASGSVALTYPYALFPNDKAMLWQAASGMKFKLLGGYIQNRSTQGNQSQFPALLSPPSVQGWLANQQGALNVPWPLSQAPRQQEIKAFARNNKVDSIIVYKNEPNSKNVTETFSKAFGTPKDYRDVYVWTGVQSVL